MQGAMAQKYGTKVSYIVPMLGFACVIAFGVYARIYNARMARLSAKRTAGVVSTEGEDDKGSKDEYEL